MKQCSRCAAEINDFDEYCPRCGMKIEDSGEKIYKKSKKHEKSELRKQKKQEKKLARKQLYESKTNFDEFRTKDFMTKKEQQNALKFDIDSEGEFDIDTSDVEIIDEETSRAYDERQTYSIKKARGEYYEPKIKWWEIYKLANRSFARRKIKKEVNKAAKIKPESISKSKLLILAVFFGWFGAHNFYAKNKKKAWTTLICLILWVGIIGLAPYSSFFASIQLSIGGFAGFIVLALWIADIINICSNNFKYRVQKIAFISKLNIKTRAKLGNKYIDMDLYKKPFAVRFKHWLISKRKDYAEYKQKRRQRLIEKEKEKLKKQQEQDDINRQIEDYENFEEEQLKQIKNDNDVQEDIKSLKTEVFGSEDEDKKQYAKKRTAKISINKKKKK